MSYKIFTYKHHVDGSIDILRKSNGLVEIRCRWPFDLQTDEWIEIQSTFRLLDYTNAVRNAFGTGRGEASGVSGGALILTISPEETNSIKIEISNSADGFANKSLQLMVPATLAQLETASESRD
jgi:hypothetical protein